MSRKKQAIEEIIENDVAELREREKVDYLNPAAKSAELTCQTYYGTLPA